MGSQKSYNSGLRKGSKGPSVNFTSSQGLSCSLCTCSKILSSLKCLLPLRTLLALGLRWPLLPCLCMALQLSGPVTWLVSQQPTTFLRTDWPAQPLSLWPTDVMGCQWVAVLVPDAHPGPIKCDQEVGACGMEPEQAASAGLWQGTDCLREWMGVG